MSSLSISSAWRETKALFASDGRLFASVSLALIGLPTVVATLIEPESRPLGEPAPVWVSLVTLIFGLLALTGQLALVRLALKPSVTVGEAIAHAARRMPVYLGTVLIIGAALAAIAIPLAIVAFPNTVSLDKALTAMTPRAALALLAIMVVAIFLGVRMLMGTPVASAEHIGPIAIIKRSWALTSGKWWKLFGFLMALFIAAAVLMLAIGAVAGSVLTIALGPIESMSVSALLIGLVQGLFNAAFTALFAVMIARIYVQLSGRDAVEMTD